ncbi:MAG TPA: outer membrane protein assembly factor BamD [Kofleriaceae bacterium]|nr:outer membrane protein assembly factor BamD [Kofleriaceae bacterium]
MVAALLAFGVALGAGACGGKSGPTSVDYSVSAQKNYERGMKMLGEKEWIAAAKYFAFIKSRFPYSKYAVLAELRLADAEFGAEQYLESVDSYKMFAKLHPTHEMVANGYVSLRVAEAYYEMLPGDFWLVPPSYEKDQSSIEDASEELRSFLDKYPDSPFYKKAQELLAKVSKRLADHEWYVARYYWDRGKPMGTVLRLRRLLERYSGVGYDVQALWLLGRAYEKVGMPDRARETWDQLVAKFPKSSEAGEARAAIARLRPNTPVPGTAPPLPAPAPAAPLAPPPAPPK